VIGGTSGIGRTISLGLADAGADVIASARRQELVEETAAEIECRGRQILRLSSDLRNRGWGAGNIPAIMSNKLNATRHPHRYSVGNLRGKRYHPTLEEQTVVSCELQFPYRTVYVRKHVT
jgi:NAD(P)-dependent dehydrogenase (short-subunit alcohol dehydrogenase family)